jgi:predicted GNAT family acetyltransferase
VELVFRREDDGQRGGWFIDDPAGGEALGEITYRWTDGAMEVVHTGVRDALKGKGAARKLVQAVVDAARAEGFRVIPTCPYARKVFRAEPPLHDVLAVGVVEQLAAEAG